ncbi:MAG: Phosphate transport regulator (distant homolog of PhoU), partial [uncultured Solirubrobacteraceae bacterium]
GPALAGLRTKGPRVLRSLRGGGAQRPARGRAARRDAARVSRGKRPCPLDPALRAGRRPDHVRHDPAAELDVRDADRSRGHPRAGVGTGRHRRPHRGGRRLPRPLQDRGADGAGPAPGAHPHGVLPARRGGRPADPRLQGPHALHERDPPAGDRGRPGNTRGGGFAVRHRDRSDGRDPLEGHLRAPRGGDRRHGAHRERHREHRHQELL